MNTRQRFIISIGIALGCSGLLFTFFPGISPGIQVTSVIIAIIAVVTIMLTFYFLNEIFKSSRETVDLPNPEHRSYTIPGTDIDHQIRTLSALTRQQSELSEAYETFRGRVENAAISVFFREVSDDEQPREQLIEGEWPPDSYATAFFSDSPDSRPSMREQLRSLRTGEPPVQHRARHAIAALVRRFYTDWRETVPTSATNQQDGEDTPSVSVQSFPAEVLRDRKSGESPDQLEFPDLGDAIERRTDRWQGVSALALAAGGAGMFLRRPAVLLVSVIGVGLAAYARAATPPTVDLEIERTVSDTHPPSDDDVEVTVTVQNVGDTTLPKCTLIDGVPSGLVVTDGSPRYGTALRPGKTTTFSYTLLAARGEYTFDSVAVIARDFSGSVERLTRVNPAESTTISCVPRLEPLDVEWPHTRASQYGGRVRTDTAGNGVEFHAVREYQSSDPRSRIDWNRLAKTGELSTLQFHEERVPNVVVVIDARNESYLAPAMNERSAVDRSVEAAGRVFATLLDDNTNVGITALSPHPQTCWLAPRTGSSHQQQARQMLAIHPALSPTPPMIDDMEPGETGSFERLRARLPTDAQVVVLTPLCDDEIAGEIQQLQVLGYAPTVISPDPTALNSPGQQLAHIERALRMMELRSSGIPAVNWGRTGDGSLSMAIQQLRLHRQHSIGDRSAKVRGSV